MDRVENKARGLGSTLGSIGRVAAVGIGGATAAVAGLGAIAIKTAADFQQSLANVQSATGATTEQMALMRKEALGIGADTSKSASEAVEAMGELAKAGMAVETIVGGAARSVVQMAEATGISVPEAAVLASNALNTFKADGLSAAQAADTLAKTANASAIGVTDVGMALSAVGAVAAGAGLSLSETATAIGIMGNNAIRGSDAGTSLKAMLAGLTPNSDAAAAAMQQLGINAFNADGSFKSMREIVANLSAAFGPLNEQQRATYGELIFGSDAVRALNVFLKEGTGGWDAFGASMAAAPSLAEQSAIRMNTLSGRIEALKGSLETIAIEVGTAFLPALSGAVTWVSEHLPAAMETGRAAIGAVTDFVKEHVPPILDTFRDAIQPIAVELEPTIEAIRGHLETAVRFFREHWDQIEPIVRPVLEALTLLVETNLRILVQAIAFIMNIIQGDWSAAWENVKNILTLAWDGYLEVARLGGDAIIELVKALPGALLALSGLFLTALQSLGEALIDGIKAGVQAAGQRLIEAAKDVVLNAIKGMKDALDIFSPSAVAAREVGEPLVDGVIIGVMRKAAGLEAAAKDVLIGAVSKNIGTARKAGQDVGDALGEAAATAYRAWVDVIRREHEDNLRAFSQLNALAADAAKAAAVLSGPSTSPSFNPAGQFAQDLSFAWASAGVQGLAGSGGYGRGGTEAGGGAGMNRALDPNGVAARASGMGEGGFAGARVDGHFMTLEELLRLILGQLTANGDGSGALGQSVATYATEA